jgi:hypothetical protein
MTSEQLYLQIFSTRERTFCTIGDSVFAADDSGGFQVASCEGNDAAPLIAQILNELRQKVSESPRADESRL